MINLIKLLCVLTILIFCLPSKNLLATSTREHSEVTKEEYDTVQAFREKGKIGNLTKIESIEPNTHEAKLVVFMERQDDVCPVAAKVFADLKAYRADKGQLKEDAVYLKLVNDLRRNCHDTLPYLVEYLGSTKVKGEGAILFTKAKGKTIEKIHASIGILPSDKIVNMFKTIGQQLGGLDALFFTKNNRELLQHPDSNLGNLLYDEKGKQLYWIDFVGLKTRPGQPDIGTYIFARQLENSTFKDDREHKYSESLKGMSLETAILTRVFIEKSLLALKSLYEGYASILDERSVANNTKQLFNRKLQNDGSIRIALEEVNKALRTLNLPPVTITPIN